MKGNVGYRFKLLSMMFDYDVDVDDGRVEVIFENRKPMR